MYYAIFYQICNVFVCFSPAVPHIESGLFNAVFDPTIFFKVVYFEAAANDNFQSDDYILDKSSFNR